MTPHQVKLILALVGMGLAALGAIRDDRRISWVAIVLLAIALVMRLVLGRRQS